jgi:pimeloyl-ACP methyl ester carboxylesterase
VDEPLVDEQSGPKPPPPWELPRGEPVELPGRGTTFVRSVDGPPDAPTVVLLHGMTATADLNWFTCYAALGRHFRVVALDQRGHGRGIRTQRFRLEDCADDVAALAAVLGVSSVIPVGYSMGGPVAQLTWRRHRDLVDGLVLCATSRNWQGTPRERVTFTALPYAAAAMRLAPEAVWQPLGRRMLGSKPNDPPVREWVKSEIRRNSVASIAEAAAAIGQFNSAPWIGEVDVPTAVIVTTRDQLVPPHRQRKLANAIPGATVHEVDGDHGACGLVWRQFVPTLVDACRSVADRANVSTD